MYTYLNHEKNEIEKLIKNNIENNIKIKILLKLMHLQNPCGGSEHKSELGENTSK